MKNRVLKTTIALTFLMQSFHGFAQETPPAARNPDLKVPPVINGPTNPPTTPLVPGTPVNPPVTNNNGMVLPNLDKSLLPGIICPLVDNQPNSDITAAANALFNNIAAFATSCGGAPANQANAMQGYIAQITKAGDALKSYLANPDAAAKDPAQLATAQSNISTLITNIGSVSLALQNNTMFNSSCAKSSSGATDIINGLSGLMQAVTPVATSVLSAVPGFTEAIPFVLGLSAAGNVAQVIGQMQKQNSLNMDDPKVRLAVLQNICEYTRIVERVKIVNAARAGDHDTVVKSSSYLASASAYYSRLSQTVSTVPQQPQNIDQVMSLTAGDTEISPSQVAVSTQHAIQAEAHVRDALAQSTGAIEASGVDSEMRTIKYALFGERPTFLFMIGNYLPENWTRGTSPVVSWYEHANSDAQLYQADFSKEMKALRDEAQAFAGPNGLDMDLVREGENGFLNHYAPAAHGAIMMTSQSSLDFVNNLTPMNLSNIPAGSDAQAGMCNRLNNALDTDWRSTMDNVKAMIMYCGYIGQYMDQSFDPAIRQACIGSDKGIANPWADSTHPNSDLSILRKQLLESSQKDVKLLRSKQAELQCSSVAIAQ